LLVHRTCFLPISILALLVVDRARADTPADDEVLHTERAQKEVRKGLRR